MRMNPILKKLHIEEKEFVTSDEIRKYCNFFDHDYYITIRNLTSRGYLLRIFKGVFYLKTFDEVKLGKMKYSHLDLVSKGLELKGVETWYFGLQTALKLNNATHEHFTLDHVINDSLFRSKPITINGYRFKIVKLKKGLFGFGMNRNKYKYSNMDKTILDLIYIWRYNGKSEEKIIMDISEYRDHIIPDRIIRYSLHYPKSVRTTLEGII